MPVDVRKLAAMSELPALETEISALERTMKQAEAAWLVATAIPNKPDRMRLVLRPGFEEETVRAQWAAWQVQLTALLERRVELLRELDLDQEAVNGA